MGLGLPSRLGPPLCDTLLGSRSGISVAGNFAGSRVASSAGALGQAPMPLLVTLRLRI